MSHTKSYGTGQLTLCGLPEAYVFAQCSCGWKHFCTYGLTLPDWQERCDRDFEAHLIESAKTLELGAGTTHPTPGADNMTKSKAERIAAKVSAALEVGRVGGLVWIYRSTSTKELEIFLRVPVCTVAELRALAEAVAKPRRGK